MVFNPLQLDEYLVQPTNLSQTALFLFLLITKNLMLSLIYLNTNTLNQITFTTNLKTTN